MLVPEKFVSVSVDTCSYLKISLQVTVHATDSECKAFLALCVCSLGSHTKPASRGD